MKTGIFWLSLLSFFVFSNHSLLAQPSFSTVSMQNAANYSADMGGTSTLIMQNGNLVFEEYHNGADSLTVTHLHSATKGFWSILAAQALETGMFQSYDEAVANTITEWQNPTLHPGKSQITIRHLLQLSSGLSQDVSQIQGLNPATANIYQYVTDSLNLNSFPGSTFQYGPSHYYVFGVLLERKLHNFGINMNPLQYLDSIIFQPIGFEYDSWAHDSTGNPHIPNGCFTTSRNWIKYGKLLLQYGNWNGIQLVDSTLVQDLFIADGPNHGHAKFLWANNLNGQGSTPSQIAPPGSAGGFMYYNGYTEIIGLLGAGKNRMYIIPSLNAVILRQTLLESDNFIDNDFLSILLEGLVSGIENKAHYSSLAIFPNPANNNIFILSELTNKPFTVQILNANGAIILNGYNQNTIDVSNLPNGLYFIQIQVKNEKLTQKFIKN
jgi:CubicO group peptidase (beta-lactamase class C family)